MSKAEETKYFFENLLKEEEKERFYDNRKLDLVGFVNGILDCIKKQLPPEKEDN